ncbi:MAG: type VI secretion system baseplate subunit TssF [Pseudomonadota bacterium]
MAYSKYYQAELQNLRELAVSFSKVHPAAAPLLGGPSGDPDVERLLEGVAFLTGLLRQKLDDELPEIVRGLMDIVFPHYLRPLPSVSMVAFTPKPNLQESITVPAGTSLGTNPVGEAICTFRTCYAVEAHPLKLESAERLQQPGAPDRIRLRLALTGPSLDQWTLSKLTFSLGGSTAQAMDLYLLLTRYVRKISIVPAEGGRPCVLPPSALAPAGFDRENNLLPFPTQSFSGYRWLQEYFALPQKFLFLNLTGWEQWQDRGKGQRFDIVFEMLSAPIGLPRVSAGQFLLFTTPVINLFDHESDPISLDHRQPRVRVRPSMNQDEDMQVYSVDRVTGFTEGSVEKRTYAPLSYFSRDADEGTFYQVARGISPVHNRPETFLIFTYPAQGAAPSKEVLTIRLTCTNGSLPERLQLGDICCQTSDSPELLTFRNIIPPTAQVDPPLGGNGLWRLLSHLSLNLLSLMDLEGLKELLRLYLFPEGRDKVKITANLKRVEGISDVTTRAADRLIHGVMVRGQEITMTVRKDNFASLGDLFLFGSVMDAFFSEYSSMNAFTQLRIKETISGETYSWPERIGDRRLI